MLRLLTFRRLSVLFLGVFAVCVAGVFVYTQTVTAPGDKCENNGGWWDPDTRVCAQPISIAEITGRPIGVSRAEASAEKNRELVEIERRLVEGRREQNAENARQLRQAFGAEQP